MWGFHGRCLLSRTVDLVMSAMAFLRRGKPVVSLMTTSISLKLKTLFVKLRDASMRGRRDSPDICLFLSGVIFLVGTVGPIFFPGPPINPPLPPLIGLAVGFFGLFGVLVLAWLLPGVVVSAAKQLRKK